MEKSLARLHRDRRARLEASLRLDAEIEVMQRILLTEFALRGGVDPLSDRVVFTVFRHAPPSAPSEDQQ